MPLRLQNYCNRHSLSSKVLRLCWNLVWLLLFRPTPRWLGYRWRVFLLRLFGARIGRGCHILPSVRVWQPWKLRVGDYSCLSERVDCYNVVDLTIGSQVVVSQDAFLCGASHDISSPIMELIYAPIVISDHAWVASRAFVSPGVTIGEGAVVGACSVVTRDVPAWTVVAGNPARAIKRRELRT